MGKTEAEVISLHKIKKFEVGENYGERKTKER
jgi:hypothetical protein